MLNIRYLRGSHELFSSFSHVFLVKVVSAGLTLFLSIIFARLLEVESLGKYFFFLAIVNLLSVVSLYGLRDFIIKHVPLQADIGSKQSVVNIVKASVAVVVFSNVLLLVVLYSTFKLDIVQEYIRTWPAYTLFIVIVGSLSRSLITVCAAYLISLKQSLAGVVIEELIPRLVQTSLVVLLAFKANLELAIFTYIISLLFALMLGSILCFSKNLVSSVTSCTPSVQHVLDLKQLLLKNTSVYMTSVLAFLRNHGDILLLSIWLSSELLGIYGVAQRISLLFILVMTSVNTIVSRKISLSYHSGDYRNLKNYVASGTKLCCLIGGVAFLIVCIFRENILLVFGEQYLSAASVLILIAFAQLMNVMASTSIRLLVICGRAHFVFASQLLAIFVLVSTYIIFVPSSFLLGAGAATALSAFVQSSIVFWYARAAISGWQMHN